MDPAAPAAAARRLLDAGCYEVSLGDTTGAGTPASVARAVRACAAAGAPPERLAAHFHDTYGQALANLLAALALGVRTVDSAVGGLGGCPFARGATGNVATEDVVWMLRGLEIDCGIDLDALIDAGQFISTALQRDNQSRVARALGHG